MSYQKGNAESLRNRALSSTAPTNGQALAWNQTTLQWEPTTISGGGGGGTVTSVGLSAPPVFTVAGSPITGAGTLALSFAGGQTANQVLASPDGAAGAVSLRALVATDIPALDAAKIASGQFGFARLPAISTNRLLGRSTAGSGLIEEIQIGANLALSGGILSAAGGGGGSPAGSGTELQFRNGAVFGAVASSSVSGANLTLGGTLTLAQSGGSIFRLLDTVTSNIGFWDITAADFFNQGGFGVHNHTLGIHFNTNGALTGQPRWGENWEPRYVPAATPNGLLEKNWDFTSIDGLVSYRPFNFNVNLNTNEAEQRWIVGHYGVVHRNGSIGAHDALRVITAANGDSSVISSAGRLVVGVVSNTGTYRATITGAPAGTVMLGITPSSFSNGDILIYQGFPSVVGDAYSLYCAGPASGLVATHLANTGTGGAHSFLQAGSGGDAWTRWLANQDWSAGVDRSDSGRFKLSNADTLGVNDRLLIAADGSTVFTGQVLSGTVSDNFQGQISIYSQATGRPGLYLRPFSGTPLSQGVLQSTNPSGTQTFQLTAAGDVHPRNVPLTWPSANGAGALTNDGAGNLTWTPGGGGGGGGTVTSVALSAPSVFSVTGSPVTGAGTLALSFASGQTANQVLASPDGAAGAVSLRALVATDLPALDASKITTGQFGFARLPSISTNRLLGRSTAGSGVLEEIQLGTNLSLSGGVLSAASGGAPGGSGGAVQYTDGVSFLGTPDFTFQQSSFADLTLGNASRSGRFILTHTNGSVVRLIPATTPTESYTLRLPGAAAPSTSHVLGVSATAAGGTTALDWVVPSGGGSPAGADRELQFNNGGAFGAISGSIVSPAGADVTLNGFLDCAALYLQQTVNEFNAQPTSGMGVAPIYRVITLTAVSTTQNGNLQVGSGAAPAGLYRVSAGINTNAPGASGTVTVTITWNDGIAARSAQIISGFPLNVTGADNGQVALLKSNGAAQIQFTATAAGNVGATFDFYIVLERFS